MSASPPNTPSPCIGVCWLDHESGFCVGCHRTAEEIGSWMSLDDSDRERITRDCEERRLKEGA